jgi:hypothetical protein
MVYWAYVRWLLHRSSVPRIVDAIPLELLCFLIPQGLQIKFRQP